MRLTADQIFWIGLFSLSPIETILSTKQQEIHIFSHLLSITHFTGGFYCLSPISISSRYRLVSSRMNGGDGHQRFRTRLLLSRQKPFIAKQKLMTCWILIGSAQTFFMTLYISNLRALQSWERQCSWMMLLTVCTNMSTLDDMDL